MMPNVYVCMSMRTRQALSSQRRASSSCNPGRMWSACVCVCVCTHLQVFVLAEERVKQRGYATMFELQTKNPKSWVYKYIFSFKHRRMQVGHMAHTTHT